jgi:hypothetical protein
MKICFNVHLETVCHLNFGSIMQELSGNDDGVILDSIESSSQKVDNKINFFTKNNDANDYPLIDFDNDEKYSEEMNDKFITIFNYEEDNLHRMIRKYKTRERKFLIRIIRIITDCKLKKNGIVRIIFCNEVEYIMFNIFAELLIKFIVYHKNHTVKIESCQFRNGKCYFIKLMPLKNYKSNRIILKENEIPAAIELELNGQEIFETFEVVFEIPRRIKDPVINNFIMYENIWIIDSNFEFILKLAMNIQVRRGFNRICLNNCSLKGGNLIPINIQKR